MTYAADPRVDAYIDALPDWRQAICREVRDLLHAADHEVPRAPPTRCEATRLARKGGLRRLLCFGERSPSWPPISCPLGTTANELAREGVALNIIQRQLGHSNLGTTSIYLQGIDPEEIITAVHTRRAPMMSATAGLKL